MPNQDQPNPTQNQPQNPINGVPFSPQADLPPLPPEFQNLDTKPNATIPPENPIGSAAPPTPTFANIAMHSPKKKFGTGRIIATILGVFLLVGGVGTGIYLVQQKQLFNQKAWIPEDANVSGSYWGDAKDSGGYNPATNEIWVQGDEEPTSFPSTNNQSSSNLVSGSLVPGNCVAYYCPEGCGTGGCDVGDTNVSWTFGSCENLWNTVNANSGSCGQIDYVDTSGVYTAPPSGGSERIQCGTNCSSTPTGSGGGGGGGSTTTTSTTYQCQSVKVYDTNWTLLDSTALSNLKAGDVIRLGVVFVADGTIDKARFTVNGTLRPEVTTLKPGATNEIYDEYTIPEGTTSFSITGQIHNTTIGWF